MALSLVRQITNNRTNFVSYLQVAYKKLFSLNNKIADTRFSHQKTPSYVPNVHFHVTMYSLRETIHHVKIVLKTMPSFLVNAYIHFIKYANNTYLHLIMSWQLYQCNMLWNQQHCITFSFLMIL